MKENERWEAGCSGVSGKREVRHSYDETGETLTITRLC